MLILYIFSQGSTAVRAQAMASLLRSHLRHIHATMEVPTTAPRHTGRKVRLEALADRRNRLKDRATLLPLLPPHQRDGVPPRSLLLLLRHQRTSLLLPGIQGRPLRAHGQEAKILRKIRRRLFTTTPHETSKRTSQRIRSTHC